MSRPAAVIESVIHLPSVKDVTGLCCFVQEINSWFIELRIDFVRSRYARIAVAGQIFGFVLKKGILRMG